MSEDRVARCGTVESVLIANSKQSKRCDDGFRPPPHLVVWLDGEEGYVKLWPLPPGWRANLITAYENGTIA